mmetsp:Transcript_123328/g.343466  ORF Transcript_123328/g.343466 Transcript_123328/m.343466 type:complete len:84 (+) Transcript_123328:278-529(+)
MPPPAALRPLFVATVPPPRPAVRRARAVRAPPTEAAAARPVGAEVLEVSGILCKQRGNGSPGGAVCRLLPAKVMRLTTSVERA